MAEHRHRPQARRSFLRMAGAAGLSLLLAACQVIPPSDRLPRAEPIPVPTPIPTPTPVPTGPNRVAVLVPLSGANAGVGQSISNAANLALLDAGEQGVTLNVYDTAPGAAAAASQAIAEGNRLILGPLLSEDVRAVAPLARQAGVPVISFSNDVGVAGNGVYLLGFNPAQSINRVVAYARGQNADRFAALVPDGAYGRRAGQAMVLAVEGGGGRMAAMETYGAAQPMRLAVTRLNADGGYDAVLIADAARNAGTAAAMVRGAAPGAKILGTELWKTESNLGATQALRGAWYASVADARFNELRTRYRARYSKTPYRLASLGYDSVLLAMRIARDWQPGRPFPEAQLRGDAGFDGVDGAFRFGADNVAERALEVVEVTASGNRVISPAPQRFGE